MQQLIRSARDLRADVFRGVALWSIFIDHVPGNWLGMFTIRNFTMADATEVFVFLAGYAGGIAYGLLMLREGWFFAATRVMGRVGTLYVAHIFLFVVFTAQVGFSAATLDRAAYLDELQMDAFGNAPYEALVQALLLAFQPAFLNILPLYIVLLAMFALALPLLHRPWLFLGASLALYAVVRGLDINLPSWTGGGWFFNPLAWQLLFVCGAVIGFAPPGRQPLRMPWSPWLLAACLALLIPCGAAMLAVWHAPEWLAALPGPWPALIDGVDKTSLHPLRLLSLLAMAYLAAHLVPRSAAWLNGAAARPFVLMGQRGLPVFCASIFLSFLGRLALEREDGPGMQLAVNALGLACLLAVAWVSAWYGQKLRIAKPPSTALPAHAAADRA
jgi:hypothetical protein